jgi:hypothetical protein
MVDIQTVSIVIASASIVTGILYYFLDIRNQSKMRQSDLVMRLYTTFHSREFQTEMAKVMTAEFKDYDDAVKKYGWEFGFPVGLFFEGIGVLLNKKLVDISLVDDLFTFHTRIVWEKIKPIAEGAREHFKAPTILEWFEYLYNEMQKREQKLQHAGAKNG